MQNWFLHNAMVPYMGMKDKNNTTETLKLSIIISLVNPCCFTAALWAVRTWLKCKHKKDVLHITLTSGVQLSRAEEITVLCLQGFMQDEIIARHTCFGGHVDVNC